MRNGQEYIVSHYLFAKPDPSNAQAGPSKAPVDFVDFIE